jgi:hypothetical protein
MGSAMIVRIDPSSPGRGFSFAGTSLRAFDGVLCERRFDLIQVEPDKVAHLDERNDAHAAQCVDGLR